MSSLWYVTTPLTVLNTLDRNYNSPQQVMCLVNHKSTQSLSVPNDHCYDAEHCKQYHSNWDCHNCGVVTDNWRGRFGRFGRSKGDVNIFITAECPSQESNAQSIPAQEWRCLDMYSFGAFSQCAWVWVQRPSASLYSWQLCSPPHQ